MPQVIPPAGPPCMMPQVIPPANPPCMMPQVIPPGDPTPCMMPQVIPQAGPHLGGRQRQHGLGELRLQLVKDGCSQALGAAPHDTRDLPATRVTTHTHLVDSCGQGGGGG